jgi:hypothetical protein
VELKEQFVVILELAKSCARQITAWITSIENSSVKGKRYRAQAGIQHSTLTHENRGAQSNAGR